MSEFSLIYVSHGLLSENEAQAAIKDIIAASLVRNARENITGALLYTGANFVQILEGPEAAVGRLMDGIKRDPRHDQVEVLETMTSVPRLFEGWSMAYIGDSLYVRRHVEALLTEPQGSHGLVAAIRRMRHIMRELVHTLH